MVVRDKSIVRLRHHVLLSVIGLNFFVKCTILVQPILDISIVHAHLLPYI